MSETAWMRVTSDDFMNPAVRTVQSVDVYVAVSQETYKAELLRAP